MSTPHIDQSRVAAQAAGRSPLWAVLVFAFLNSIGTGVVSAGLYFLARHAYGFTETQNFLLGLLFGASYIPAALFVGPGVRRMVRRMPRLTNRRVLAAIMLLLAVLCWIPLLVRPGGEAGGRPSAGAWTIWLLMGFAGPLHGALWPITESYVSGGRSGRDLRAATGRFNIVWSSALVVSFWAMGPLLEAHPLWILAGQGVLHAVGLLVLTRLRPEPGRHVESDHEPHPPVYRRLLTVFRIQLPASFLVIAAIEPYLPTLLSKLALATAWTTPAAATWMAARLAVFAVMERWHGWQGRWSASVISGVLMLGGFAVAVLSPTLGSSGTGVVWLLGGLASFGAGAGAIYASALYYAMEVGRAEVDAGGIHEALIGLGYSVGPVCGLAAIRLSGTPARGQAAFETYFIVLVTAIAGAAGVAAFAGAVRQSRRSRPRARAAAPDHGR